MPTLPNAKQTNDVKKFVSFFISLFSVYPARGGRDSPWLKLDFDEMLSSAGVGILSHLTPSRGIYKYI